jgi:transcriptional regulator with PAS, ATPase and Fis domain
VGTVRVVARSLGLIADFARTWAGKKIKSIQEKALEALQQYSWPGNVRELPNVIERSLIIGETNEFSIDKSWFSSES